VFERRLLVGFRSIRNCGHFLSFLTLTIWEFMISFCSWIPIAEHLNNYSCYQGKPAVRNYVQASTMSHLVSEITIKVNIATSWWQFVFVSIFFAPHPLVFHKEDLWFDSSYSWQKRHLRNSWWGKYESTLILLSADHSFVASWWYVW